MTKKSILALVSAVFFVLVLAACGNDKNKEESENTDTGDTDTAAVPDTDQADTGDTETVPDEEPAEVEDTEIEDTEVVPDTEPTDTDFKAVDVGECLHEEPAFTLRDRIYTETDNYPCKEYVEVTEKKEKTISFKWFGAFHCDDWEYGYEIEGIEENVLKVSIKERDLSDLATDCDNCCRLMLIEYAASSAEEIESIKGIEIYYEGKNHTAYFEII